mgnify:CR=1 FL=1
MPRAYFNAKKDKKKPVTKKKKSTGKKRQGYKDREDESLGARKGKKSQSFKARRDEAQGARKKKSSKKEGRSSVFGLKKK